MKNIITLSILCMVVFGLVGCGKNPLAPDTSTPTRTAVVTDYTNAFLNLTVNSVDFPNHWRTGWTCVFSNKPWVQPSVAGALEYRVIYNGTNTSNPWCGTIGLLGINTPHAIVNGDNMKIYKIMYRTNWI